MRQIKRLLPGAAAAMAAARLLCGCAAVPHSFAAETALPVPAPRQPGLILPALPWAGAPVNPGSKAGPGGDAEGASGGETSAAYTPLEAVAPGRWLYDFVAEIGGRGYAFPFAAGRFAAAGWQMQANAAQPLMPGEYADLPFEGPAGRVVLRVLCNGGQSLPLADCLAVGLVANDETTAEVTLPGGVGVGMPRAALQAACGRPEEGAGAVTATYAAGRLAYVTFTLAGGRVAGFTLFCQSPPAPPPAAAALPRAAAAWRAPEAQSGDWRDFTVDYGGRLLTLPVPVAQLLWGGWLLRDEATLAPGAWLRGVSLQKDGMVLRTMVYNPEPSPQILAHCFVAMLEETESGMNLPLTLAGGLNGDSTPAEVTAAFGRPSVIDYETNGYSYVYKAEAGKVVFSFSGEDDAPYDLEVWHYPGAAPAP